MGPDGKDTAQAAVYIDGQPVQYAGEITLPEQVERPAPPLLSSMGFTMEQANEAARYLAEAFRIFYDQLAEAVRAVADAGLPLPPHEEKTDPQEIRQADPGLVSGGGPVSAAADSQ